MSKGMKLALFLVSLFLVASMTQAARPEPAENGKATQQQPTTGASEGPSAVVVEGCGDECMMRRTLDAHLDYIYTQEKKN